MATYKILRFRIDAPTKIIARGLTLQEAREHCSRANTHKYDKDGNVMWFDGYTRE